MKIELYLLVKLTIDDAFPKGLLTIVLSCDYNNSNILLEVSYYFHLCVCDCVTLPNHAVGWDHPSQSVDRCFFLKNTYKNMMMQAFTSVVCADAVPYY